MIYPRAVIFLRLRPRAASALAMAGCAGDV